MPISDERQTGKRLSRRWGVDVKHALYRKDGQWYHRLTSFPGALFDANGYVVFETLEEYLGCPKLQIGEHLHVPEGISAIASYVSVRESLEPSSDAGDLHTPDRCSVQVTRIVRDTPLARRVKALHAYACQLCGARLQLRENQPYAEGHHLRPLGSPHYGPDMAANLVCVCPNCHTLLDYGVITLNRSSLRVVPGHVVGDEYLRYHNEVIVGAGSHTRQGRSEAL